MGYVSHLACPACGADVSARPGDEPLRAATAGRSRWCSTWSGSRPSAAGTAGGTRSAQPLAVRRPAAARRRPTRTTAARSSRWARGTRRASPTPIRWPTRLGCRLEVKDEGKPHPGFGANPTLSFKDRGMAMTVSMARALGLTRLAVPTQGNAGDSLAEYAVAGGDRGGRS